MIDLPCRGQRKRDRVAAPLLYSRANSLVCCLVSKGLARKWARSTGLRAELEFGGRGSGSSTGLALCLRGALRW